MSNADYEPIAKLAEVLIRQKYSPVVVGNYCCYAQAFLEYLAQPDVPAATVTPPLVARYLRHAIPILSEAPWPPARPAVGSDFTCGNPCIAAACAWTMATGAGRDRA